MQRLAVVQAILLALLIQAYAVVAAAEGVVSEQETLFTRELERANILYSNEELLVAMDIYRELAEKGYAPAQLRLAWILDQSEDNQQAAQWYRKAADKGNLTGQYELGKMYAYGEGVEQDIEKALFWVGKAAEAGHSKALEYLVNAYQSGDFGLDENGSQAIYWRDKLQAVTKVPVTQVKGGPSE